MNRCPIDVSRGVAQARPRLGGRPLAGSRAGGVAQPRVTVPWVSVYVAEHCLWPVSATFQMQMWTESL